MDWDTKVSSSSGQWDWENLMLFPLKGSDIGRKAQWTTPPTNHHTAADAEMDNESVFSHSASAAFGYVSSSTTPSSSAGNTDCSINFVNDLCKVKTEILEEDRNVNFWDLGRVGGQDFDRGKFENGNFRGAMEENRVMKAHVFNSNSEEVENHNHVVADNNHKNDTSLAVSIAVPPLKGDAHLGLKLGKRTYFEDTSGAIGGGGGGTSVKASSPITMFASGNGKSSANANASSASSTSAPPVPIKKHRGPSLANQTPRCQVEGCNKDLCGSKEYHRRHKVCDVHSKSAKVIVSGAEQRFCQQCSRFHALSEFDDGKRSCRRRLAGHNERRRKPPPDPMALNSVRFASSSYDGRRSGLLFDRSPPLIHPRLYSGTVFDIHGNLKTGQGKVIWPKIIKSEDPYMYDGHILAPGSSRHVYGNTLSRQNSDRLLHLLECSRVGSDDMHQSIHPLFPHSPAHHFSQPINVQSSSGIAFSDLDIASATPTNLSGVSDSGRALSLLSCQSWGSRPPAPTSTLDMTSPSGILMDPYMDEDNSSIGHVSLQGMHNNFHSVTANTSESSTGIGSYETALNGPSWLGHEFKSPSDVRSKDVRRTINLMQRSVHSEDSQTQSGVIQQNHGPSMEFQLMRTYEPSLYDSQHM